MGMQIKVLNASTSGEIHAAFATFVQERPDALFVSPNSMFTTRRVQLAHLTTRHRIPATYASREFAEVGGLMSYGSSQSDNYRQVGISASSRARSLPTCPSPIHADVLTLALRQTDRSNRRDHRSCCLTPRPNPHSARGTRRLRHRCCSPPAISCLGAFRTPAAGARGWSRHPGVRKPAHRQTCNIA